MNIGLDLDEVLASLTDEVLKYHNQRFNTNFKRNHMKGYELEILWNKKREEVDKILFEFFKTPEFKNLKPVEGAQKGTKVLSKYHTLFVITSRPEILMKETKAWINKFFAHQIKEVHFAGEWTNKGRQSKAEICKNLKVKIMIEDSLRYASACAKEGITTFLLDYPWNQSQEMKGVHRVSSWNTILEKIAQK